MKTACQRLLARRKWLFWWCVGLPMAMVILVALGMNGQIVSAMRPRILQFSQSPQGFVIDAPVTGDGTIICGRGLRQAGLPFVVWETRYRQFSAVTAGPPMSLEQAKELRRTVSEFLRNEDFPSVYPNPEDVLEPDFETTEFRPLGLLGNVAFYLALIAWPVVVCFLMYQSVLIALHRRRLAVLQAGWCPQCRYDIRHSVGVCPECGASFDV